MKVYKVSQVKRGKMKEGVLRIARILVSVIILVLIAVVIYADKLEILPFEEIYKPGTEGFDRVKVSKYFPIDLYVADELVVFSDEELKKSEVFKREQVKSLKAVNRVDYGLKLFDKCFKEIYKIKSIIVKDGKEEEIEGYVLADSVVRRQEEIKLPKGKMSIWVNNSVGCWWYEPCGCFVNQSVVYLEKDGKYIYLGSYYKEDIALFKRKEMDYFIFLSRDSKDGKIVKIFNYDGDEIWSSNKIVVPYWVPADIQKRIESIGSDPAY